MTHPDLLIELVRKAITETEQDADAANVLLCAAGAILHATFGSHGSIAVMRNAIDEVERQLAARRGQFETVQ